MFIARVADLVKGDGQSVPAWFSVGPSAHDVGVAAHPNSVVTTALFDERDLDAQWRARLDPLRIKKKRAARADIDRAQVQRLGNRLAGDAEHGERKRHAGSGVGAALLGAHR